MSKTQSKITFLEKKKTSTRLQEKFSKKEKELNFKQYSKNEVRSVRRSHLKSPIENREHRDTETNITINSLFDEKNNLKVKLLCRKNPTVLIYRSPIKGLAVTDKNKETGVQNSPSKTRLISSNSVVKESNLQYSPSKGGTTSSFTDIKDNKKLTLDSFSLKGSIVSLSENEKENKELNEQRSPRKREAVLSYRPMKESCDLDLRRSPSKKGVTSSIIDEKENKLLKQQRSPSKRGVTSLTTEEKENKVLNQQRSPSKRGVTSLITEEKENKVLNHQRSPSKRGTISSNIEEKENKELNQQKSPYKSGASFSSPNIEQQRSPRKRGADLQNKTDFIGEGSSPPKQKCTQEETPSQLITKLTLGSPERQQGLRTRKELFPNGDFDEACKALHSSAPSRLPGREDKLEFLKEYLIKHSEEQTSGTLYISGPPGTGKTACVNIAMSDPQISEAYKVICLNCTTMNSCGSIYNRIVSEMKLKVLGHSEKAALSAIEKYLESSKRKMMLIVLDELDQLCTTKQSVLYSVFEWPSRKDARLVLIGIANALDLTDRVLPRLQARLALQPTVIHFPSYTRQQIISIIANRLSEAGVEEVFSSATLQLLAGKVAAVNGDVRRALDIARRVVEVAEKRMVLQPISGNGSSKQTVALQEVMSVINDVYNTAQSLDSSQTSSFPLQQKLLICSLLLICQTSKAKDVSIGKLHDVYKKVCERRNMSALDVSEFISLTSLVEARGILRVIGRNHNRRSKVVLQWDEGEVKSALRDKQLLAAVLMDKGVAV